jgi:hypothetical protein
MTSASLTVTSRTGAPLLHIGGSFTAADLEAGSGGGKVVILRRDPQRYAMALVADWSSGHRVTHQENHVVQAVGNVLESWVRQLVQQTPGTGDRRAGTRGFDDVLERCARDAVQDGAPVTVLVISFRDVMMRSEQTQTHVSRLREYLRGGDLVGRLNDGDVGVLLHDTDAAQADVPVGRLQQLLARDGIPAAAVSIGMATRVPGDPITGGLAHEARQRAHDARVNQP